MTTVTTPPEAHPPRNRQQSRQFGSLEQYILHLKETEPELVAEKDWKTLAELAPAYVATMGLARLFGIIAPAIVRDPAAPAAVPLRTEAERRTEAAAAAAGIIARSGMVTLSMIMPNGKTLGDCTGADMRVIVRNTKQALKWQEEIARRVAPRKHVRDIVTAEILAEIIRATLQRRRAT